MLFETLLQPHDAATEVRISDAGAGSVVLVAQDTGSVNCSAPTSTEGLGPSAPRSAGRQGLHLHSSLAMTQQGVPLGFVDAQC